MRKLTIDDKIIDDKSNSYVIAEIGHNHQGDLATAKKMFRVAKECGANAVKLQKRENRSLYTKAIYDKSVITARSANSHAEHYILLTVIFASVLFFGGIASNISSPGTKKLVVICYCSTSRRE